MIADPKVLRYHKEGSWFILCRGSTEGQSCYSKREIVKVEIQWGGKTTSVDAPPRPKVRVHPTRPGRSFIREWDSTEGQFDVYERSQYLAIRRQRGPIHQTNSHTYLEVYPATYS